MEVVEHELAAVAKDRDLVADVLTLVAQAMCFGEAQKESLEDEPRKKVDMMLGSADFAPYRQAALEAPAVKRRVEDVQRMRAAAANKKAEQLKRERDQKRKARPNKKKTPLQEAADRLEVDEDMLRAVASAMTMSEAQVDAACATDAAVGEKLRGVREGAAFGEIREACVELGLVNEAADEMRAALKDDKENLDDSQLDAAEQSMAMPVAQIERLPPDARKAVQALRSDPAFAGVRAAVEARKRRRAAPKPPPKKKAPKLKPAKSGNVAVVMDSTEDDDLDGAWSEAVAATDDDLDGAWSESVAAVDDDADWSAPVAAEEALLDALEEAVEDLELEDDIDDDDVANTPDHALQATSDGYTLTVALPAGVRAKDVDCDGRRCRIVVPGREDLIVRFAAPVDPKLTEAKFSKKTSRLVVAFKFPSHASFMEDLGRHAKSIGYVPPMSGLEEVNDGVRQASRGDDA